MTASGDPSTASSSWLSEPDRLTEREINELVQEWQDRLLRAAYRRLGNADDAQEAVSSAFIKLWKAKRPQEPKAYLWTVLGTCCTDVVRERIREEKHRASGLEAGTEAVATALPGLDASERSEEERVHDRLGNDCKDRVLAASTERDRAIFRLKAEGRKQKDIAAQFDLAPSRITQVIDQMVKAFRDCIQERYAAAAKE